MVSIALCLIAIKISIVLEININSPSSTDRGEGTSASKFFQNFTNKSYFSYLNQLTSYFPIQGIQKEKERKHLRGSGEIAKKNKDWKKMVSR